MAGVYKFDDIVFGNYEYEIARFRDAIKNLNPWSIKAQVSSLLKRKKLQPCVVLAVGEVGLGKTELASYLMKIAGQSHVKSIWVDWRSEQAKYPERFKQNPFNAELLINSLYTAFRDAGYGKQFKKYESDFQTLRDAELKFMQAVETPANYQQNPDAFDNLRRFSATTIRLIIGAGLLGEEYALVPDELNKMADGAISEAIKAMALGLAKAKLSSKEYDVFINGTDRLAQGLAEGIKAVSTSSPICVVLDQYELVEKADPWLRYLIRKAGSSIVWILTSEDSATTRLLENYREDPYISQGLIDIKFAPLNIEEVGNIVNNHPAKKRDATPGEIKDVYNLVKGNPLALSLALDLWYPGGPKSIDVLAPAGQRSKVTIPVFERYFSGAIEQEQDSRFLKILAFCYEPQEELLKFINHGGELTVYDALKKRYPYLFDKDYKLTRSATFWLREALLQDIEKGEFIEIFRTATKWYFSKLMDLEDNEGDLPACVERSDWKHLSIGVIYHSFWQGDSEAYDHILEVLRALLFLPKPEIIGYIEFLWQVVGPLADTRGRLTDIIRDFQQGVVHLVLPRDIPSETKRIRFTPDGVLNERDQMIANVGHERTQKALERLETGLMPHSHRFLAVQIAKVQLLSSVGNYYGAAIALDLARRSCDCNPKSAMALFLGRNYRELGNNLLYKSISSQMALKCLVSAEEFLGKNAGLLADKARAYQDLCNYEKAIEVADEAIAMDRSLGIAYNVKGGSLNALRRYSEAIEVLKEGLIHEQAPHIIAVLSTSLGIAYMNHGNFDAAEEKFNSALVADPTFSSAMVAKGLLEQRRNPDAALLEIIRAIEYLYFIDDFFAFNLIRILEVTDDDTAIEILENNIVHRKKLNINPNAFATILFEIGKRYLRKRSFEKALHYFDETVRVAPRYIPAYFAAAQALRELHRYREVRRVILTAFEMDLGVVSYVAKEVLSNTMKMSNKALRREARDLPRSMRDGPEVFLSQGAAEFLIGNSAESMKLLRQAAKISDDFFIHLMMSYVELDRGNFDEAIRHAEDAAIRVEAEHKGFAYHNLAKIHEVQGQYEKAEDFYHKALEEFGKNYRVNLSIRSNVLFDLALMMYRTGKEEDAVRNLENAVASDPTSWPARISRIILLMKNGDEGEAALELRRIERDNNWEQELEALDSTDWRSQELFTRYAEFVTSSLVAPVLMAGFLVGSKETVNRVIAKAGVDNIDMIDYSHPIFAIAQISWPELLPEMVSIASSSGENSTTYSNNMPIEM